MARRLIRQAATAAMLVLLAWTWAGACRAATYYVDDKAGHDRNNGLSPDQAWQSLQKVSRSLLRPGDVVLFRRGGIWRESFRPAASGAPGSPIVMGAYGEGPRPSLRGSDDFSDPTRWFNRSGNLWYTISVPMDPVVFVHDGKLGTRVYQRFDLKEQWDYYYDVSRRRLFVVCDKNPAEEAKLLEVAMRPQIVGPQHAGHMVYEHLDFRQCEGVAWVGWGAHGVTFRDCTFAQAGRNHLQFNNGSRDGKVVDCVFDDWNVADDLSYAIQAIQDGSGPVDVIGCVFMATRPGGGKDHTAIMNDENSWIRTVRGCTFKGMGGNLADEGVVIWHLANQADTVTIEDNVFTGLGGSPIQVQDLEVHGATAKVVVRRNLVADSNLRDDEDKAALRLRLFTVKSSVEVSHNLIVRTFEGKYPHQGIGIKKVEGGRVYNNLVLGADNGINLEDLSTGVDVRNNVVVGNRGAGIRAAIGSSVAQSDYNCVFRNGGEDYSGVKPGPHALRKDPLLRDDFRPGKDSPLRDAGVDVGLTRDLVRTLIPQGKGPDIGPFELK